MTTYNTIEYLISNGTFKTYDDAWNTIMNAYSTNKIDGNELVELAKLAERKTR